jgi:hypothetical protein
MHKMLGISLKVFAQSKKQSPIVGQKFAQSGHPELD